MSGGYGKYSRSHWIHLKGGVKSLAAKKSAKKASRAPARTLEGYEEDIIRLAFGEAERQIRSGKASPSILLHFLRQGSKREALEQESIRGKMELDKAKIRHIETDEKVVELYTDAIKAMSSYRGEKDE